MRHALAEVAHRDTSSRAGRTEDFYCTGWTCADGSVAGLHIGGALCDLDDRPRYDVDVYVYVR